MHSVCNSSQNIPLGVYSWPTFSADSAEARRGYLLPLMFQVHALDSTFTRFGITDCPPLFVRHRLNDIIYLCFCSHFLNHSIFFILTIIFIYDSRNTLARKCWQRKCLNYRTYNPRAGSECPSYFANMSILSSGPSIYLLNSLNNTNIETGTYLTL